MGELLASRFYKRMPNARQGYSVRHCKTVSYLTNYVTSYAISYVINYVTAGSYLAASAASV
jgi:hypothetical protein